MEMFNLDATVEVTEGAIHNLGTIQLLIRIRASTYLPHQSAAQVLTMQRDDQNTLSIDEYSIDTREITSIVAKIEQLGLLEKKPHITPEPGNITGWQELVCTIKLNGKENTYAIVLQYAGISGEDAPAMRELLQSMFTVARVKASAKLINLGAV